MDIVMRPRQGGKTYELVKILVAEVRTGGDPLLIVDSDGRRREIERMVGDVLHEYFEQTVRFDQPVRRVFRQDIAQVMDHVRTPQHARERPPSRRSGNKTLVDDMPRVLETLLGMEVHTATVNIPKRADYEFIVQFTDERIDKAWERERAYRLEQSDSQRRLDRNLAKDINRTVNYGGGPGIAEAIAGLANNPNVPGTAAHRDAQAERPFLSFPGPDDAR